MKKWIILLFTLPCFMVSGQDIESSLKRIKSDSLNVSLEYNTAFNKDQTIQINGTDYILKKGEKQIQLLDEEHHMFFIKSEIDDPKLFYLNDEPLAEADNIPLWLSVIPPLIAILIALLFKEVIIALFIGIFSGAFIYNGLSFSNLMISLMNVVDKYILHSVADADHMSVIIFSLLIGGMVAVISKNGGMLGIVNLFSKWANSPKNAQIVTWFLGIAIFFDDYANTLIVGNAMRPVTDKFRVSREKLAYIVDSTAAPIAAIAFVTTWIGAELGYIQDFIDTDQLKDESAYGLFIDSLSYAFYPILAIIFILLLIVMKKDFGPMFKAEHRTRTTGEVSLKIEKMGDEEDLSALDPKEGIPYKWYNAGIPILTVLGVTLIGLVITGFQNPDTSIVWDSDAGFVKKLSTLIGNSNSYTALLWSSLCGLLAALLLSAGQGILSIKQGMSTMTKGIQTMFAAIIILIFAWGLAHVTEDLHTADYLTNILSDGFDPMWLPILIFILAALISFSTGSSWGTMAILYPLSLPLTWELAMTNGYEYQEAIQLLLPVISVVLSGSVLGDHCSPISDTTILSSLASQCNHIDHVKTQLPYALVVGGISCLLLFLAGFGLPFYINFPLGITLCFIILKVFGKSIDEKLTA